MTLFSEIQSRVKLGQDKLLPLVESAKANPTIESILANAEVRKVLDQSQDAVRVARTSVEGFATKVEASVRGVESQGRTIIKTGLTQAINSTRKIENDIVEAANRALDGGQKLAEQNAPFLVDYVAAARKAVVAAEGAFNKIQATAAATAGSLPIADYDALNAKSAAQAVKKLNAADLATIAAYEAANKNRSTVLNEIEALLNVQ